jgi:hypothetical protein
MATCPSVPQQPELSTNALKEDSRVDDLYDDHPESGGDMEEMGVLWRTTNTSCPSGRSVSVYVWDS